LRSLKTPWPSTIDLSRGGRIRWVTAVVLSVVTLAAIVAFDYWRVTQPSSRASFIGRQACINCHQAQATAFHGSHHDLAMDLATDESVLGDFNDVQFEHHGLLNRLYRDGKRFMVYTEGPDGEMQDFEVKYVFGVTPLQQYMVEFDRTPETPEDAIARLQVLRISWDTLGKRWFYLSPPDVSDKLAPDDDLHWTGIAQRWNTMCAECHSTELKKNYDPHTRQYQTTFSEIDVSCEACHGPGSQHVELASRLSLFWDRQIKYGLVDLKSDSNIAEVETCAPCHSRRGNLAEGHFAGASFCDYYEPSILASGLYHDDGQILDEVYEYGSFVQSRMYHKGIRCTDCHDPHSLQLKAPGNQVCTSCHQHPAGKYDSPSHHKHAPGKPGSACVDCHMPSTTYMQVDPRRDHSLRIPRPDLSVALGTPNACTGCHLDPLQVSIDKRPILGEYADWLRLAREGDQEVVTELARANRWCDDACNQWYGETRRRDSHFAEAFHAAQTGQTNAIELLEKYARDTQITPAIARATALELMGFANDPEGLTQRVRAGRESLNDPAPMVRAAAIEAVSGLAFAAGGAEKLAGLLAPLLDDDAFLVRSAAAKALVSSQALRFLPPGQARRAELVIDEIKQGLGGISDRSGAHMEWALLNEGRGDFREAIDAYRLAMQVEPNTAGPRSNLATLLENLSQSQLQQGKITAADVERNQQTVLELRQAELPLIERDAALLPDNANLQYRLGLAYYLNGHLAKAIEQVQRAVELEPENTSFSETLKLLREQGASE
jgi:tetratricopeptide (TPR) repeat protein